MARMIPDPYRRNVRGTAYVTAGDEYTQDGTCVGIGTIEITTYARACGIAYASPLPVKQQQPETLEDLFLALYSL